MFSANYPLFERGRLLKTEMLEALRDFPRDLLAVYLKDYDDGILMGCEITTKDQFLVIEPGIIIMKGIIYILNSPYEIPYLANNRLTLLKVNCLDKDKEKDFIRYASQIYLDYQITCKDTEIELCRFKLKEGARLRGTYKDFYDYNTEYDTVNRIHVPYAKVLSTTFAPEIIKCFAKQALMYGTLESYDFQFCMLALQYQGSLEKSVITTYLVFKGEDLEEDSSQEAIYLALTRILQMIESGGKRKSYSQGFGEGIWVD